MAQWLFIKGASPIILSALEGPPVEVPSSSVAQASPGTSLVAPSKADRALGAHSGESIIITTGLF